MTRFLLELANTFTDATFALFGFWVAEQILPDAFPHLSGTVVVIFAVTAATCLMLAGLSWGVSHAFAEPTPTPAADPDATERGIEIHQIEQEKSL
jgi:hypothetical protein